MTSGLNGYSHSSRPAASIVLGIDPGTAVTGFGVIALDERRRPRLVECGVLRTKTSDPLHKRLHFLHEGIVELIARHRPDTLAVEDVFYARNVRTTVVLGHARGVILLAGAAAAIDVREFPPAVVKKNITGRGAATKEQVQFMVAKLLKLEHPPQPADAADAVAVALTSCLSVQLPSIDESRILTRTAERAR